ncbi:MAG TPA: purine-nucleoside phosphorylase [Polyangiaceae bacterium]
MAAPPSSLADPRLADAIAAVKRRLPRASGAEPLVGLVLGSGLGGFADSLVDKMEVPYSDVPYLLAPSVAGHAGRLCFGNIGKAGALCLQGRVHLYEGHDEADVVFGCRLLAALGCRAVLLTNAAGGIREDLSPPSLMLITDHLNLTGRNPLSGPGHAFVDLTRTYDPDLRSAAHLAARAAGVTLREGVYAGVLGPSYETPAEIRMLRALGADAVGMSTVMEAIALRHAGVRVGAMSCITNLAAGLSGSVLSHADVQEMAKKSTSAFEAVLARWVGAAFDVIGSGE